MGLRAPANQLLPPLCTAYFNGSETGQANKREAPPFQNLEAAAEANDQTVEEFCTGLVGGRAGGDKGTPGGGKP